MSPRTMMENTACAPRTACIGLILTILLLVVTAGENDSTVWFLIDCGRLRIGMVFFKDRIRAKGAITLGQVQQKSEESRRQGTEGRLSMLYTFLAILNLPISTQPFTMQSSETW